MIRKYIPQITVIMLGALIVFGAVNAIATSNTVSNSRLDELSTVIAINDKKPAACTMTLASIIVCTGGICNGNNANNLILGTSGGDTINGNGGRDCILGGDGDDIIQGNGGKDVCFGGPGTDIINCETIFDP